MIAGTVDADLQANVRITIHGPNGREAEVVAVVDTGFNGSLTLPPAVVAALDLPYRNRGRAILADGSESTFDIREAAVVWDGLPRSVLVSVVDADPLIGMRLLLGHELTVQVMAGGPVRIAPIEGRHR